MRGYASSFQVTLRQPPQSGPFQGLLCIEDGWDGDVCFIAKPPENGPAQIHPEQPVRTRSESVAVDGLEHSRKQI